MIGKLAPWLPALKLAALAAAVLAAVWWWGSHNAAQQQIGYDRAMNEVAAAARQKQDTAQTAINQEAANAQNEIDRIETERDAARRDAVGLRQQLAAAARAARTACPAGTGEGEPDTDSIGVLADLLARADERAEALAGYADRLRAAGLACERSYDAVR